MSGDVLRRRTRFSIVPEDLVRSSVSDRAFRLWVLLDRYAGKNGAAFPKRRTLATDLSCSPSSVDRAISELVSGEWLLVEPRQGESSVYTVVDEPGTVVTGGEGPSSPVTTPLLTGDDHKEAAPKETSPNETLFAEAAPPPSARTSSKPESRTARAVRLARHICDSSADMKALGFHPWREAVDALLCHSATSGYSDEQILDVLRGLVRSGLGVSRQNAVRVAQGTLGATTVGRRVDNRHHDRVAADDPEEQRRRAAWS